MKLDVIYNQDCLEGMKRLPDECIDLIACDPPYSIGFMGKKWDQALPSIDIWKETLRVLKPGAFAFVMCIPRQDCLARMIVSLEDAGFNVSFSSIYHTFASGFPKAQNIGKAVDKRLGIKRKIIGKEKVDIGIQSGSMHAGRSSKVIEVDKTVATSPQAQALDGSYAGFQPKPAVEVILVAMKPLSEKTYIDQALKNGKGITWLDDCRVPYEKTGTVASNPKLRVERGCKTETGDRVFCQGKLGKKNTMVENAMTGGRFPANLCCGSGIDVNLKALIEAKNKL